jgi:ankyrin repeat protein
MLPAAPLQAEFLLQNGVPVDATTDAESNTALHIAVRLSHVDCVKVSVAALQSSVWQRCSSQCGYVAVASAACMARACTILR